MSWKKLIPSISLPKMDWSPLLNIDYNSIASGPLKSGLGDILSKTGNNLDLKPLSDAAGGALSGKISDAGSQIANMYNNSKVKSILSDISPFDGSALGDMAEMMDDFKAMKTDSGLENLDLSGMKNLVGNQGVDTSVFDTLNTNPNNFSEKSVDEILNKATGDSSSSPIFSSEPVDKSMEGIIAKYNSYNEDKLSENDPHTYVGLLNKVFVENPMPVPSGKKGEYNVQTQQYLEYDPIALGDSKKYANYLIESNRKMNAPFVTPDPVKEIGSEPFDYTSRFSENLAEGLGRRVDNDKFEVGLIEEIAENKNQVKLEHGGGKLNANVGREEGFGTDSVGLFKQFIKFASDVMGGWGEWAKSIRLDDSTGTDSFRSFVKKSDDAVNPGYYNMLYDNSTKQFDNQTSKDIEVILGNSNYSIAKHIDTGTTYMDILNNRKEYSFKEEGIASEHLTDMGLSNNSIRSYFAAPDKVRSNIDFYFNVSDGGRRFMPKLDMAKEITPKTKLVSGLRIGTETYSKLAFGKWVAPAMNKFNNLVKVENFDKFKPADPSYNHYNTGNIGTMAANVAGYYKTGKLTSDALLKFKGDKGPEKQYGMEMRLYFMNKDAIKGKDALLKEYEKAKNSIKYPQ